MNLHRISVLFACMSCAFISNTSFSQDMSSACQVNINVALEAMVAKRIPVRMITSKGGMCRYDFSLNSGTSSFNLSNPDQAVKHEIIISKLDVTIAPRHGELSQDDDHSITYTPILNYVGRDSFIIVIKGTSAGKEGSSTANFDVTVE